MTELRRLCSECAIRLCSLESRILGIFSISLGLLFVAFLLAFVQYTSEYHKTATQIYFRRHQNIQNSNSYGRFKSLGLGYRRGEGGILSMIAISLATIMSHIIQWFKVTFEGVGGFSSTGRCRRPKRVPLPKSVCSWGIVQTVLQSLVLLHCICNTNKSLTGFGSI